MVKKEGTPRPQTDRRSTTFAYTSPPADLLERIRLLNDRFRTDIKPGIEDFVQGAKATLEEYRAGDRVKRPGDVWTAIDEAIGITDLEHALYLLRSPDDDEGGF